MRLNAVSVCLLIVFMVAAQPLSQGQTSGSVENPIRAVSNALGLIRGVAGEDFLIGVQFDASGTQRSPNGPPVSIVRYRAGIRFDVPAIRVDYDIASSGENPQRHVEVAAGSLAWDEMGKPGGPGVAMPQALHDRLLQVWLSPQGAMKAARHAGAKAKLDSNGATTVLTFPLERPLTQTTMRVTLDANHLVSRIEASSPAGVTEVTYSDYKDFDKSEVPFPTQIIKKTAMQTIELTVSHCRCANPYVVFPVPAAVRATKPQN